MNTAALQHQLFAEIKRKIGETAPVADEVARLLSISTDSAYRRIRGEKTISLDELYLLCTHYQISLDQMMNVPTGSFLFQGNLLNPKTYRYDVYLTGILNLMAYYNSFKQKEFYYLCKDLPIFHYFHYKELAAFKYFFWMGTLVYFPEFKNKTVRIDEFPDDLYLLCKKIIGQYNQIDSVELWNIESLNSTIRQIEYYIDNRMFHSNEDALKVYEATEKIFYHLEEQAALGYKFDIDDPQKKPQGKITVYFNEIVILDNSMMVLLENNKMAMMPHTAINYITTRDLAFCDNLYNYIQNLIRRSTQISEVSEKERSRFFRLMYERIDKRKKALKG
jgi:hypothetical protein